MNIMDAQVPSQRWALPTDSLWDIHYDGFEAWVNDHYEMETQTIFTYTMTWEDACESEELFDLYLEDLNYRDGD